MKKRIIALGLAGALCLGMVTPVFAEETEGMSEAVTAAETADGAEVLEKIVLTIEDKDPIEIANTAGLAITAASVEIQEEDETLADIVMKSEDGQQYEFLNVPYEALVNPELVMDGVFAYINYTSLTNGKERRVGQTGELTYSEPAELFAVDDVYIRSEPTDDAEILGVISRGDAIEVLGETALHYVVKKDDVTGYTVRKCISEDEQDAIAAVAAEEAAREQIRRAQEAAAAAAAAQASQQSSNNGGGRKEVKRQKFDDCDGSGHGYYEITYSDGSVEYEDY